MSSDLDFAVNAVRKAGELILSYFDKPFQVQHKSKNNPVTPADLAADAFLRESFARRFPDDGWLSEETVDHPGRLSLRRVWVVDPLDGTKEFVRGLPEFAVSVALVVAAQPVLAVIYNPARDDMFVAETGQGARRNGNRVQVSSAVALEGAHILASRSENILFQRLADWTKIQEMGSIAYKLALVSAGAGDLTISFRPKNEWDVCAGALLMAEAGGIVTDLAGNALNFNRPSPKVLGMIAAGPMLHDRAAEWVRTNFTHG